MLDRAIDGDRERHSIWDRLASDAIGPALAGVGERPRSTSWQTPPPDPSIAYAAANQTTLDLSAMSPMPPSPTGSGAARSEGYGDAALAAQHAAKENALATRASGQEKEILASPEYKALKGRAKVEADGIIAKAKQAAVGDDKGQRNYYFTMLKVALTTPFDGATPPPGGGYGKSPSMAIENRKVVDDALAKDAALKGNDDKTDEKAVAAGKLVPRRGAGGSIFYIDDSDPKNVKVKMKVHLTGNAGDVAKIKNLEDAIERASRTKGYNLDIEFVDHPGPDVFEKTVDMAEWPNAGNWASDPVTLSHEAHHALGLPDRYDYIESHSANRQMDVPNRIHWFAEQMKKPVGQDDNNSKMNDAAMPLSPYDVCTLGVDPQPQKKNNKCVEDRKTLSP